MRCCRTLILIFTVVLFARTVSAADSPKRLTLPNGLRVVLKPSWSTDVVAIELLLGISAEDEPSNQNGLRYLCQRLLLRGSEHTGGAAMSERLASVGGVADATVGLDYVEIYALVPADGFEVALEILADAVQHPALAPSEINRQRIQIQDFARAARQEPFQETYLAFRESLYGNHPYGALTFGGGSIDAIERDDIVAFHRRHYVPNRAVLAICGGVGEARALRCARKLFDEWEEGNPRASETRSISELRTSEICVRERPLRRAHIILGFPAPAADKTGYYAAQVIDAVIGGGFTARLPYKLREELGIAYTTSSFYPTLASDSHLAVYVVTEPYHLSAVKAAIIELFRELAEEPLPEEELARAQSYLLGSYALSHQRMREQAYALAWYEILGLGVTFEGRYAEAISAVTADDVQTTASLLFRKFVLAIALPEG